jgi:uncharacterized protein YfaS (alpha-2-macroglobulin family)
MTTRRVVGLIVSAHLVALSIILLLGGCDGSSRVNPPGNRVVLLRQSPQPGSLLRYRENLSWTFSDAMTLDSGNQAAPGTLTLQPPVPGTAVWSHPNVLTFMPFDPWPQGRDIRATLALPPSLVGRRFKPVEFVFYGAPPMIASVTREGEDVAGRTLSLRLLLTQPLNMAAFRKAFTLAVPGGTIPYTAEGGLNGQDYLIRTARIEEPRVSAHFDLSPGAGVPPLRLWEDTVDVVEPMEVLTSEIQEERDGFAVKVTFSQPPAPGWESFLDSDPATNLTADWSTGATVRIRGLQPANQYDLVFQKGLPGRNGSVVTQDMQMSLSIPELKVRLAFRDRGHYLSSAGSRKVVLESVNVASVKLGVWRVYPNNFVDFARSGSLYQDAENSWSWNVAEPQGDLVTNVIVKMEPGKNQVRNTVLDVAELTGGREEGVFYLVAEDEAPGGRSVNKLVVLTDLGLSVIRHENEVLVWALSIRDGTPVKDVEIAAFSTKNQLVGKAMTDGAGLARIEAAAMPALSVVTGVKDARLVMVKLDESRVQGPVEESSRLFLKSGYEAFLYADRGIYRPGETAHVKAVVRGPQLACPAPFPVQMKVLRPDFVLFARLTSVLSAEGTAEFDLPFMPESLTGRYMLELEAGGKERVAGSLSLQVEDFVPPTLAVTILGPTNRETLGRPISVGVEARHLFGSPNSGGRAALRARLGSAPFRSSLYPDFSFGDSRRPEVWRTLECGEKRLDAAGKAVFEVELPGDLNPAAALSCSLVATVFEDSGRACPAVVTFPVDPRAAYIGLKSAQEDWKAGDTVRIQVVAVRPDGSLVDAGGLKTTLSRITWNWREEVDSDGRSQFRSDRQAEAVLEGVVAPSNGPAEVVWIKAMEGEYELAVTDASGATSASLVFYVSDGNGWSGSGFRQPDRVSLTFDRERYRAGDEAVVTLRAPFPGQVLLTLENDRIRSSQVLQMTGNTLDVRIPVKADYWPNLFVRAVVVRPQTGAGSSAGRVVVRAVGVASLVVSRPEAEYRVAVSAPARLHPLTPLEVEVVVKDGASNPVPCEVTVSAVDEGILRLTGYTTPEPLRFFGESRNLDAWLHDVYALLLPDPEAGLRAARLHTGGDAMGDEMAGRLNPIRSRRFVPVALWSGTVRTDAGGRAHMSLPVPEFSGQLRITAVAVGAGGFGSADKAVQIRRDWVVQATLPRAAAPGDRFNLGCSVYNESGASGVVTVVVTAKGALAMESTPAGSGTVPLMRSENKLVTFPLVATGAGLGEVLLDIQAGHEHWTDRIEMPVRPPWPRAILSGEGSLLPGRSARIGMALSWFPNTGNARLLCSGQPGLEGLGALDFLNDYPYGCLEQTISRAFPYLVAGDLIAAAGRGYMDPGKIGVRVGVGIRYVLALQTPGGGFSLWPRQMDAYDWGSAYAVLFLAEAKAAGYAVPQEALDRGCAYLSQHMSGWLKEQQLPDRAPCAAMALQALAAAGKPDQAALSRLAQFESEWDVDTRARLVLAFLAAGRRSEAGKMLASLSEDGPSSLARESGAYLRSSVRHAALMLDAWLQVDPVSPAIPPLVNALLKERRNGHWETTQENAAVLLALGRYAKQHKPGSETCQGMLIATNGETRTVKDAGTFAYDDPRQLSQLMVSNSGSTVLYYAWTASGVPAGSSVPQEDRGIRIRRTVMGVKGASGAPFKQGDLAVVKLTVEGMTEPIDNLVIEELLPGGLEIENPDLQSAYASIIPEGQPRIPVRYQTVRDDRLIAFTGLVGNSNSLFYLVRAVTPGEFVWPPATVACMYDPSIRSLNGGGKIRVEP